MGCASSKRLPFEPNDKFAPNAGMSWISTCSTSSSWGDAHQRDAGVARAKQREGSISSTTTSSSTASPREAPQQHDAPASTAEAADRPRASERGQTDGDAAKPIQPATPQSVRGTWPSKSSTGTDHELENRTLQKKKKRKSRHLQKQPFLSDLPEVDADIHYRVSLLVLGMAAEQVIQSACASQSALSLGRTPSLELQDAPGAPAGAGGDEFLAQVMAAACAHARGGKQSPSASMTPMASASRGSRCLCRVNDEKVAKLAFTLVHPGKDLPACATPYEALNTVMVITLVVSGSALGEEPDEAVREQLEALSALVGVLRDRIPTKLRPVRAVLLCSLDEDGTLSDPSVDSGSWAELLEAYEEQHGRLWKFGPVRAEHGEEVHAVFADMVSTRVGLDPTSDVATNNTLPALEKEPQQGAQEAVYASEASLANSLPGAIDDLHDDERPAGCARVEEEESCSETCAREPTISSFAPSQSRSSISTTSKDTTGSLTAVTPQARCSVAAKEPIATGPRWPSIEVLPTRAQLDADAAELAGHIDRASEEDSEDHLA